MAGALSNPTLVINNIAVPYVPNSIKFKEGLGEQNVRVQSAGGGSLQSVFSDNAESKISMVGFSVYPTPENIALVKGWKQLANANAISLTDTNFSRTFANMALTSDYDVNLGADTTIDIEFMGDAAA